MLTEAGYDVDYVPPDQVTVAFYRDLPRRGYNVIVVRSHSSQLRHRPASSVVRDPAVAAPMITELAVGMFTNEPDSFTEYVDEQRAQQLSIVSYPGFPERGSYFGITIEFVQEAMRGNFDGATFVLMGCGGLSSTGMAQAFVDRGVSDFISWDDAVTAAHTDLATERLLKHLLDGSDAAVAVEDTMAEVGVDPAFNSRLLTFP